jgi:uncharacterized membrane protein
MHKVNLIFLEACHQSNKVLGRQVWRMRLIGLKQLHHSFVRQALYPVLSSTLLACGLLGVRIYWGGVWWTFLFLAWNLFLAWIPFLLSLWTAYIYQRQPQRWAYLLILALVWLAFFPNAPYIVTDFLHLQPRPPIPIWYDIGLLTTFAWAGLFLAVFSLRTMQTLVKACIGSLASWLFVAGVIGLSGLGIYLGRFLHWNSWDLLFHPRAVLADVVIHLTNPLHHLTTFGVTLLFGLFLLVCYLTIMTGSMSEHSSRNS